MEKFAYFGIGAASFEELVRKMNGMGADGWDSLGFKWDPVEKEWATIMRKKYKE